MTPIEKDANVQAAKGANELFLEQLENTSGGKKNHPELKGITCWKCGTVVEDDNALEYHIWEKHKAKM